MDSDNESLVPVVAAGLRTCEDEEDFNRAMNELESLCEACDLKVAGTITQSLPHPDNATWLGSGKAEELTYLDADVVPGGVPEPRTPDFYQKRPCLALVTDAARILDEMLSEAN